MTMADTRTGSAFCVLVRFILHPGARRAFEALVIANAAASVAREPGCTRFDVLAGEIDDEVLLYELYDDETAFAEHLASPHFNAFDAAAADLVAGKTIQRFRAHEHSR